MCVPRLWELSEGELYWLLEAEAEAEACMAVVMTMRNCM